MKFDNSKIPEGGKSRLMNDPFVDQLHLCICCTWGESPSFNWEQKCCTSVSESEAIHLTDSSSEWIGQEALAQGIGDLFDGWMQPRPFLMTRHSLQLPEEDFAGGPRKTQSTASYSISSFFSFLPPSPSLPREIRLVRLSIEQVILSKKPRRSHLQSKRDATNAEMNWGV